MLFSFFNGLDDILGLMAMLFWYIIIPFLVLGVVWKFLADVVEFVAAIIKVVTDLFKRKNP